MAQIIQWNARGLLHNLDDIKDIISQFNPTLFCVQETHLKPCHANVLKKFTVFRKDREGGAAGGGVAIIANAGVIISQLHLNTSLEAVAVRVHLKSLTTVVSLYIPPNSRPPFNDLLDLVEQLPKPFLILGDMNAHHPLWGSEKTDAHGKLLEKLVEVAGLHIFNNGEVTYFNAANRSFSCIDLSIGSLGLSECFMWEVIPDPYGSDHFPIMLRNEPNSALHIRPPSWKLGQGDWTLFQELALINHAALEHLPIDEENDAITNIIIEAASKSIPKTSGRLPKCPKPWWNNECRRLRKLQSKMWKIFKRYPTIENLIEFKKAKARSRFTRRQAKRMTWQKYVSEINSQTPSKYVWEKVRRMNGNNRAFTIPLLSPDDTDASLEAQANILGEHFCRVSSSCHYTEAFLKYKNAAERKGHRVVSAKGEYNCEFTVFELKMVLANCKPTAIGPDNIHYTMLQNLSANSQKSLLSFFNRIWESGQLPKAWKTAIIVPILKPGKDRGQAASYRPVALTSCLCKTFERLVNARLIHVLEQNKKIDPFQCGFREHRSTTDQLVRLETQIREAHAKNQFCLSVFFDLEKAYDTTWRYGILQDLAACGIGGNMYRCIRDFLSSRTFRVRLGNTLSNVYEQENGVPQGSVLSVTLFILKINSVAEVIPHPVQYSLYVDDIQISYSSCNLSICERQIQLTVNRLEKWATENGFKFSPEKSACMCFSRKRGLIPEPSISLYGKEIPVKSEYKFLGLVFDTKLTFGAHIKSLKLRAQKACNILKILSHKRWGADRLCMLRLYRSLVRSKLDYGSIVYGSARHSTLKTLDPIHHSGLRLATGAYRTSPVESLYVECAEPPLELRRNLLSMKYAHKVLSVPDHPCRHTLLDKRLDTLFRSKKSCIPTFAIRVRKAMGVDVHSLQQELTLFEEPLAPWLYRDIICNFTLTKYGKKFTSETILQKEFLELQCYYRDFSSFFTDGSKTNDGVGAAASTRSHARTVNINAKASVFTAEMYGMLLAIQETENEDQEKTVIYTDSKSVMDALSLRRKTKNPLLRDLIRMVNRMMLNGKVIHFCWIPSHVGISGNELADCAAKTATLTGNYIGKIPIQDHFKALRKSISAIWQQNWAAEEHNKLHLIKPIIKEWKSVSHRNRFYEVLLARLRIGHTHATHNYLLRDEESPLCEKCGQPLTVQHILITCPFYEPKRRRYFSEIYRTCTPIHPILLLGEEPYIPNENLFEYLKDIGIVHHM